MSTPSLTDAQGGTLLKVARSALEHALGGERMPLPDEGWLYKPGATFVTLKQDDDLRGCIGSLAAERPLGEDVQENAVAAGFRDPRFGALQAHELDLTRIEVTLLSELEPFEAKTEAACLSALRPGVDGLVIAWGWRRATFIPQMWEQLPDPKDFLRYLKRKAGMPQEFWHESMKLHRFTAAKWKEAGFGT